ncbi:MAG TPA: protein phosphatase 2C domain-containing protein [Solirubrobacteraceae bacterium]|nr:protein phosphatase 2C domain-containing protein [Solirubrobacteraceae bacterium]
MTAAGRPAPVRRRVRLARGPVTIGEAAASVEPRLASAEPYRPDTIADGGTAFGLTVRAASVRGLWKRYTGGPRQDDICLRLHADSGTLIAAVADGVSGAPRSDLGAALAVRYATAAVARFLDRGPGSIDWAAVFEQAAWALVEEHRRASGDGDAGVEEASRLMATTLLVATVSGSDVEVAAVGDSPAFVLAGKEYDALVGEPQRVDGFIGGGVDALPRSAGSVSVARGSLDGGAVLLLCTDGLAMPLAGGTGEVGRTLARELARPPDVVDFARLLDFSRSTYDDDRSLVAVWGSGRP